MTVELFILPLHAFRAGVVTDVAHVKVRSVAAIVIVVIFVDPSIELVLTLG